MKNKKIFILLLLIPVAIFFISKAYSLPQEVRSVEIESEDYDNPGSWHIDKRAEWTGFGKAKVTFDINTIRKVTEGRYLDVVLIIDVSSSMEGIKIEKAKSDAMELAEYLLSDSHNSMALITFSDAASLEMSFTNNKTNMVNAINELSYFGNTNYDLAFKELQDLMPNYIRKENTDLVTLFLTDGYPNENHPNQVARYHIIKDKYPYMEINGIQYEMGTEIIKEIIDVTDNQWVADVNSLNNVLFDAALATVAYDNFIITDYINDEYFYINSIDDVKVPFGEVNIEEENGVQKVIWNLGDNFKTFSNSKMEINITLKEEYHNTKGLYPTNKSETIKSKLPDEVEKTVDSELTPILQNAYNVIYNTNTPTGCTLDSIPTEEHFVYQTVTKRQDNLTCDGYLFKGWLVDTSNDSKMKIINDDIFVMPNHDVNIIGLWTKENISKSMDGTVYTKTSLYRAFKDLAEAGVYAKEYTGEHQDSMDPTKSTKKIYHWYTNTSNPSGSYYNHDLKNKINVIFGGFCWQMMRTTDTGGVKLLYNGLPTSGQCLYEMKKSIAYSGYTSVWFYDDEFMFGTDYTFDEENKVFKLSGDVNLSGWNENTKQSLIGKYTCKSVDENDTCSVLYLIVSEYPYYEYANDGAYAIQVYYGDVYQSIGLLPFNSGYNSSLSEIGYMYNQEYRSQNKRIESTYYLSSLTKEKVANYWFADSYNFNESTGYISLVNPYKGSTKTSDELVGKYTFFSNDKYYSTMYYISKIIGVFDSKVYYEELRNGYNTPLTREYLTKANEYDYSFTYGTSYVENDDGTYTINNPQVLPFENFKSNFTNLSNKFVCQNYKNDKCDVLWHTASIYSASSFPSIRRYITTNKVNLASSFIYEDGVYKLRGDIVEGWDFNNINFMKNHHYTCWGLKSECQEIAYIYYAYGSSGDSTFYYLQLQNGESIDDAMNNMLYKNDVNQKDSIIKAGIDAWYGRNLLKYSEYIEDTIYCNDRTIKYYYGWDKENGVPDYWLIFADSDSLACPRDTDKFSLKNDYAKLKYPVGLMTKAEFMLLNQVKSLAMHENYWMLTPYLYDSSTGYPRAVENDGSLYYSMTSYRYAVRPVISLRPDVEYKSGNGSKTTPYIIDTSEVD